MKPTLLLVLANRWLAIDHKGRPAGACPAETAPGDKRFVACRVSAKTTAQKIERHALRSAPQDTVFEFDELPEQVSNSPYYRRKLQRGEIIPFDTEASKAAGLKHVDPTTRLETERRAAVERFDASNGEGAFAELEADRKRAVEAAKKPTAEAKAKAEPQTVAPEVEALPTPTEAKTARKAPKGDS